MVFIPQNWDVPVRRPSRVAAQSWWPQRGLTITGGGAKPFVTASWALNNPVIRKRRSLNFVFIPPYNISLFVQPCYTYAFSIMGNGVVPASGEMTNVPLGISGDLC